ncbi:MAG: TraR/DksA C4-type zinc finger protein [Sandaracinobacter sp.]
MLFADARLGDTVDVSQLLEERQRDVAVRRVRDELYPAGARIPGAPAQAAGRADCISCGDEISPARRAALPTAQRCTDCQSALEARKAR